MNAELEIFCDRLLGGVLTGVYQGLLLTALVAMALKLVSRANAATRHAVYFAALLVVSVLPLFFFVEPVELGDGRTDEAGFGAASGLGPASRPESVGSQGRAMELASVGSLNSGVSSLSEDSREVITTRDELARLAEAGLEARASVETEGSVLSGDNREADERVSRSSMFPLLPPDWRIPLPRGLSVILVGCWLLFAGVRVMALVWQCCALASLKRKAVSVPEPLRGLIDRCSEETHLTRRTRLLACDVVSAPMVVGFRSPAILLPRILAQGMGEVRLEPILRHELAHVRRWDDWMNLLQHGIKSIFFFHPAVWWLSRRLTVEREIACDDYVLAAVRAPRDYALFLTEFAGQTKRRDWAAAPAAWSNRSQLKERINMILDSKRNSSPRLGRVSLGILTSSMVCAALLGLHVAPRFAVAQENEAVSSFESAQVSSAAQPAQSANPAQPAQPSSVLGIQPPPAIAAPGLVESGPRPKPVPAMEAVPALAAPHPVPVPAIHMHTGNLPHPPSPAGYPPRVPHAPAPPAVAVRGPAVHSSDAIVRRLERLERMVESLLEREKGSSGSRSLFGELPPYGRRSKDSPFELRGPDSKNMKISPEVDVRLDMKVREELERMKDHVAREAERSARELERAAKELERATKEAERNAKIRWQPDESVPMKKEIGSRRQMLESQRKALAKQLEAIEKQLADIEQERESVEPKRKKEPVDETAVPKRSGAEDSSNTKR